MIQLPPAQLGLQPEPKYPSPSSQGEGNASARAREGLRAAAPSYPPQPSPRLLTCQNATKHLMGEVSQNEDAREPHGQQKQEVTHKGCKLHQAAVGEGRGRAVEEIQGEETAARDQPLVASASWGFVFVFAGISPSSQRQDPTGQVICRDEAAFARKYPVQP